MIRWFRNLTSAAAVIDQQRLTIEDQRIVIARLREALAMAERQRDELFALL